MVQSMSGLAVLITIVQTIAATLLADGHLPPGGYLLVVFSGLAVAPSRRRPAVSLGFAAAATVAYVGLGYPGVPTIPALVATLLGAAAYDRWRAILAIAVAGYAVWLATTEPAPYTAIWVGAGTFAGLILSGVLVGIGREMRKMFREQRRLDEERRKRRASEERLRIAQELHDVLGHHLSLINMRARVGLHLMDRQPEQARAALTTINMASAEALREVRSVLDTLYPAGQVPPKAPAPGLAQLAALTGDAGLPVTAVVDGDPRELPAEVDRAAYRIVQEALTNVRRHAGPGATAVVSIGYDQDAVRVAVEDDGGAGSVVQQGNEGNGLSGMRERAVTLGGTFSAGPRTGGGWRVETELPSPGENP